MTSGERIEREVLERLGLLPESDPPNDEPNYEARLRALGAALDKKGVSGAECLAALALHLSNADGAQRLGLARIYASALYGLASIQLDAELIGKGLLGNDDERLSE